MTTPFLLNRSSRIRRRGLPARLGSLVLLIQRSPLLKLLPEARVLSTSGFSEALQWTVLAITGLGAFDSVSGATTVSQVLPTAGSSTVTSTAGANLNFVFQVTGAGGHTPNAFQVTGTLPAGLVQTGLKNSKTDSLSGTPLQTGSFPVTIIAWENSGFSGRSARGNFTINVSAPPAPAITAQPAGGNFTPGSFVSLTAGHTNGFTFTWKKNGTALPSGTSVLSSLTAPRKFLVPTADPGTGWRSGAAFSDSAWTSVSGGIGYDTNTTTVNYLPQIAAGGNVQTLMSGTGKPTSALLRIPFTMSGQEAISHLKLRVQSDDGFVAWLNGTEVASRNKPANLAFNSAASTSTPDATAIAFTTFSLNQHITLLRAGENLLAVQAMNDSSGSSDLLFNCELSGGIDDVNSRRLIIPAVGSTDAGSYTVTVTNTTSSVTSNPAVVVLPPSIGTHPASVSINGGQTATLTVVAATSPPFTYQWFRGLSGNTSDPVAGATAASFTTPPLTAPGKYWVRVTNAAGSTDSDAADVSVLALTPVISSQPGSVTINAGGIAQLNVTATGTGPFSYQWYTGASGNTSGLINGAILSAFTTPALTAPATYWVRVTNAGGFVNSNTATVTVHDPFTTWKTARFTLAEAANPAISGPAADPDGDGITNEREYVFGTQPKSSQPVPAPVITLTGSTVTTSFTALRAAGDGYAGRVRHYAVETTANMATGPWTPMAQFTDIIANDQTVTCVMPTTPVRTFCRLRIWLTP